jgi:hypothetical protein
MRLFFQQLLCLDIIHSTLQIRLKVAMVKNRNSNKQDNKFMLELNMAMTVILDQPLPEGD